MKHLKMFEGFDDDKKGYYEEILFDEFMTYVRESINIDPKYLGIIRNNISNWTSCRIGNNGFHYSNSTPAKVIEFKIPNEGFGPTYPSLIFEIPDEWFLVFLKENNDHTVGGHFSTTLDSSIYKCDQFDGVIELLKDKGLCS